MESISSVVTNVAAQHIDGKLYHSTNDVLLSALELWSRFKQASTEELKQQLETSRAQIDAGKGTVLTSKAELEAHLDDIFLGEQ